MFPENSVVDFVAAYDVWEDDWISVNVVVVSVEVFDVTQTVAALILLLARDIRISEWWDPTEFEIIGIYTCTVTPQIKGSLARIRRSTISIRNEHLRKSQTIKQTSTIISNIMQGQALSLGCISHR